MTSPFIQQIADNRVCQVLTCLPEKFVVDFANGIDVAQEQHPVIWSTTQAAEHLPVRMPRLCSAERLSESMVDEIFQKGAA